LSQIKHGFLSSQPEQQLVWRRIKWELSFHLLKAWH